MGFKVGSQITVDNALKTIMVKSANDMSVMLAEGVSGSIAAFAEEMNQAAARLGMTQTTYVNPNGLPADEQITSARDQAILARAIYSEMPEYECTGASRRSSSASASCAITTRCSAAIRAPTD